ncbi:MAG TPA: nuclear transport factor 2 family protein [Solirubrobacteraceae bacterium]|jgi:ketosteroid isomerase-like protein|nr:nuclear transport factor 2 family protein [Solirubrobacteraceae bacterium]
MSQENAEQFIRRLYERWNREGIRAVAEDFFDAQVEYYDDAVWPGGGTHRGRPAMIARFREAIETLGIKESVVERVVDTGDRVAWVIRATGRSPAADVPHDHRWGYVGRIAGGKLVYFRAYHDADQALKAVGPAE